MRGTFNNNAREGRKERAEEVPLVADKTISANSSIVYSLENEPQENTCKYNMLTVR